MERGVGRRRRTTGSDIGTRVKEDGECGKTLENGVGHGLEEGNDEENKETSRVIRD